MIWETAGSLSLVEGSSFLAHQRAFNYSHKPQTIHTPRHLQSSFCLIASLTKTENGPNLVTRFGKASTN